MSRVPVDTHSVYATSSMRCRTSALPFSACRMRSESYCSTRFRRTAGCAVRSAGRLGRADIRGARRDGRATRVAGPCEQDATDPCVFATYERFTDKSAMDRHNGSETVARFFDVAKPILDGAVTLITANEISAKPAA